MMLDPTDIPPEPTLCAECGEEVDRSNDNYTCHTGCCAHRGTIEPLLGFGGDPAREDDGSGTCVDCGANVHIENDGDRYIWVLS